MEFDRDSIKQEQIARTYLERGRQQNDTIKMARAYDRLARIFIPKKNIAFADSVIDLTAKMDHIAYPGIGYILKAYEYGKLQDIKNEFDNYMMAYEMAKKNGNISHELYVLDQLIILQLFWGDKQDALNRQHQRHSLLISEDYYELLKQNTRTSLQHRLDEVYNNELLGSYRTYVLCYFYSDDFDRTEQNLAEMKELLKSGNSMQDYYADSLWVEQVEAELHLSKNEYSLAASKSGELLENHYLELTPGEVKNLLRIQGTALNSLGDKKLAIRKLLKADSIASSVGDQYHPLDDRRLYDELYNIFIAEKNLESAIYYLDKIIFLEEEKEHSIRYFEPALLRDMEIPALLASKEKLIRDLESGQKRRLYLQRITAGLLALSVIVGFLYFKRQKAYKARFLRILEESGSKHRDSKTVMLSSTITQEIMAGLDQFELREGYRDSGLSLNGLAKELDTNSNYLSRVINFKFEKNFSQYLHDLRVEYAKERLLKDEKFRRYTIRAIAEESGYNSVESFSRAFYKRLGIYPSFYVRSLNKKKATPGE